MKTLTLLLGATLVLSLTGCATPTPSAKSEFYLLSAPALPHQSIDLSSTLVLVGPITMADYLKRASIVLPLSEHRYDVAKLEQWGGSLENEFQTALVKNLSALDTKNVYVRYPGMVNISDHYNLRLDVLRFDAKVGGDARLEVSWAWVDKKSSVLAAGHFSRTTEAGGSVEQSVAAQSLLIQQLSQTLVAALP